MRLLISFKLLEFLDFSARIKDVAQKKKADMM
jgi:hypothetical protein